ncbi:F-box/LRR-repeat protein At3g26922-like [Mangifera indica]|uniref:F-box/LRR-repeat protein At3g26922-like n=1 Tax=Mangifera indica TaxID=29780 RepID=UPI001CFA0F04|nr:F-box/LRR-repeat protein At3g26922-like [Mangifera indica]
MPKRNKRVKTCKDNNLSNLPDDILHQILSFIDTKFVVQTCVLSKRYRDLWKTIPDLSFDSTNFNRVFYFKKFVLDVLNRRDHSVDICKFSLTCRGRINKSFMTKVIDYLVSHNVKHLCLHVKWGEFHLPQRLIACNSINSLVMETFRPEILPGNWFGFVGLQDLHLSKMQFNYESQQPFDPFSSCQNLRNLCLCDCYLSGFSVFRITGPQLITFNLSNFVLANPGRIELLAPVLTSFSLVKSIPLNFALVELPAITNVNVQVFVPFQFFLSNPSRQSVANTLTNMFRVLRRARFVTLSYGTLKILIDAPNGLQPSPFTELEKMKLKMQYGQNSIAIPPHVSAYLLSASGYRTTLEIQVER